MERGELIARVRDFNRYYTNVMGLLGRHVYDSEFSLTEARMIFEIHQAGRCTANQICSALGMDRGYVSRIVNKLEGRGLLDRTVRSDDRRCSEITLTDAGIAVFEDLGERSNTQVGGVLSHLSKDEQEEMVRSMDAIERLLDAALAKRKSARAAAQTETMNHDA